MKGLDYFRVASNIAFDDDLEHVSDAAFRTFLELIGIASHDLTDGKVTHERARKLCNSAHFDDGIDELLRKKYLKKDAKNFVILRYKKYQKTKREVLDLRGKARDRVTRYRSVTNDERSPNVREQSKSKSKSKSIPPCRSPQEEDLVTLCREHVPGWKPSDRDPETVALGIAQLGADGMRRLILKLATYQAANNKYRDLRRALVNWVNSENPTPPCQEDDPGPQYEDVVIPPGAWKP